MSQKELFDTRYVSIEASSAASALSLIADGQISERVVSALQRGILFCERALYSQDLVNNPQDTFSQQTLELERYFNNTFSQVPETKLYLPRTSSFKADLTNIVEDLKKFAPLRVSEQRVGELSEVFGNWGWGILSYETLQERVMRESRGCRK